MNTAKKIYESDEQGVVHVQVPVGRPGTRVEVIVVWQELEAEAPPLEDWSDLFGLLKDTPLERPPQGESEERGALE